MGLDTSGKRHSRILSLFLGTFLFFPQAKVQNGIIMGSKNDCAKQSDASRQNKNIFCKRTKLKPVNNIA